jgi:hypothetical protein
MRSSFLRSARGTAVLMTVVLAVALAGCGGKEPVAASNAATASKPADQILADAQKAFLSARSVRLTGKVVQGKQAIVVDMRISHDGGAQGSISRGNTKVGLIRIGDKLWLRGRAFWSQTVDAPVASRIGDRWVLVPPTAAGEGASSIDALTQLNGVVAQVLTPRSAIVKGSRTTVRGVRAIALDDERGLGTLYVAVDGPAYPLRIAPKSTGTATGQRLDFAEYNDELSVTAPANAIDNPATLLG